ncbi:U-scoloptoxin(01)-Er1a-like [Oratosquilla oratoria]|uniref:U-scoloptoxin(01)-Er1a-like n=1 Tax=Oratosquilla oratoria TaxID=337810 RepID=UPI003F777DA1
MTPRLRLLFLLAGVLAALFRPALQQDAFPDFDNSYDEGLSPGDELLPYPTFYRVPPTKFSCSGKWGLFADPSAGCQAFHLCQGYIVTSYLCPNGSLFRQNYVTCDHWYNVECEE